VQAGKTMLHGQSVPLVTFHQFIGGARPPQRADRSAAGVIPTRAFRYCEALTSASALGWYVFSPMSFRLLWDGDEIAWSFDGSGKWYNLTVAQFPNFRKSFDEIVPDRIRTYSPPFLATLPEPGLVQIWSGLVARTRPGYSLMVRPPVNMPRGRGYELFEGVVETDAWFGPLFTNIRLTRTHSPVEFGTDLPLFQVQPIHRTLYSNDSLNDFVITKDLHALAETDWDAYHRTVVHPNQTGCPLGENAKEIRKRSHRP
jgi:hypothetical protein